MRCLEKTKPTTLGTLMANLIGCFLLIWLTDYLARILPLPKRFVLGLELVLWVPLQHFLPLVLKQYNLLTHNNMAWHFYMLVVVYSVG